MSPLLTAATGIFAVMATTMAALGWIGYGRSRRGRTLTLALGFSVFAAAGIATAAGLYRGTDPVTVLTLLTALLAIGLLLVYLAAVKR